MVLNVIYLTEIISGVAVIIEKTNLNATLTENLNKVFIHSGSNEEIWKHLQFEVNINHFTILNNFWLFYSSLY